MRKQLYKLLFLLSFSTAVGQVGINTTTPGAQLDIRSSNQAAPANTDGILIPKVDVFPATNPTTAQNGMMVFLTTAVGIKPPGFYYWDSTTSTWIGLASSTNDWALTGNSGTVPGTNFLGTTDAKDFVFKTNNSERARFTSGGFLGIGTATPAQQLQITGNFRLPASTSTAGIIYSTTNRLLHTNGGFFSGLNAGSLTATGFGNTGVGNDALTAITTGNINSAFGHLSMNSLTTGFNNAAFGYQSMLSSTTAGDNTAIGAQSLKNSTTGSRNTTVGSQSMGGATTGSDNVAIGYGTLGGALTGGFNSAVGNGALSSTTSGFNNSAFGRDAMPANTTGNRNTALGYGTLHNNIVGGSNTAVGTEAGYSALGSGNVMLGYLAGYSETGSNKLYIDNSNTVNPLIYGDFATNLLRVNGTLNINSAYSFPTTDGTNGYVLKTNGAGAVAWAPASSLITESDPNAWLKAGNAGTTAGTDYIGTSDSQDLVIKTNATEAARISSAGNVGIGTASPDTKLHVTGNEKIENGTLTLYSNDSRDKIQLTDWADMGSKINHSAGWSIDYMAGPGDWDTDGYHRFFTSVNGIGYMERMRINNNGYVGIGTVTPAEMLHVDGNIRTSSLSGTGTRMVQADTNGTLTPLAAGTASQVLLGTGVWGSVPGLTNDWSLTGNSGTIAGTNFIGTTDNQAFDLRTNNILRTRFTTKGQIETFNTGHSVFLGQGAGANDDLSNNQNAFVGHYAGTANTTGGGNSAFGYYALSSNTTGYANTALGDLSLPSNTTGVSNTVVGDLSGNSNTTGNWNAALGKNTLFSNTTGSNNTAVGSSSLSFNVSGNRNTAAGDLALAGNTTGSDNTAVGYAANVASGNLSNATAVGANASVSASNSLVLGNNANVGIGTTAPAERLEVVGNVRTSSLAGTGMRMVQADTNGTLTPLAAGTAAQVLLGTGVWGTVPGLTNDWSLTGNSGTVAGTNFIGTTDAIDFVFKTNNAERARFASTGFMGIGVAAPSAYLDIYGNNSGSNSLLLRSGNNNSEFLSSQIAFSWNGGSDYKHSIISRHNSFADSGNAIDFVLWDQGTDGISDMGTKKVMTIDGNENGKVGIGTTSPAKELEVVGEVRTSSLAGTGVRVVQADDWGTLKPLAAGTASQVLLGTGVWGTVPGLTNDWSLTGNSGTVAGTNFIGTTDNVDLVLKTNNTEQARVTGAGFVGIGTGTPAEQLQITKNFRLPASTSTTGIIYSDANTLIHTNTGFFSGINAGKLTATGQRNVGVGNTALGNLTTGNYNTAVGQAALNATTTGYSNAGIGHQALTATTTGADNTALGAETLRSNTTGSRNVALGGQALSKSVSTSENVAVGYYALGDIVTGQNNTAIGTNSLFLNTSGFNNSAVGGRSLMANTTGGRNTALGWTALATNTTGGNNTAVGFGADVSSAALTNATAIGYNAKVGASNSMVLGGTGADAVKVGIGTTSPAEELEVVGDVRTSSLAGTGTRVVQADANGTLTPLTAGTATQVLLGTGVWGSVPGITNDWSITGNAGTVNGTNFIGTTDNQSLDIRTDNTIRTRITTKGQIETLNTGNSVFVGEGAGAGDDLTDNRNTLIGMQAGQTNATSAFTTGIGYQALQNSVSNGATAVGYRALQNYTGIRGTAIGYEALKATTTGSSNTAVGYAALSKNTTGGNNTSVGSEALLNITTGSNNVGLGKYALLFTTTAGLNTAIGTSAMFDNTTGANNTAVGFQAISSNTTGNNNVALGINALGTNNTGSNNLALGTNADVTSAALTNAAAIGYNAKVAASNSMVLGGTGVDAVKVGIGTTAPAEELEVVGDVRTSSLAGTGTRMVQADTNGTLTPLAAGTAAQVLLGTGVWGTVPGLTNDWSLTGNAGTVNGTNFIGTTDNQALDIRTNNVIRTRITNKGQIETLNTGQSVFVGEGAGANDDLTNNINAFIGYQAGNANTTGTDNVGLGYRSLQTNTTGSYNTATGSNAMRLNTTGYDNVANGNSALGVNTTGAFNTGIGAHALNANTTGNNNTAVGRIALNSSTAASNNTAVGARALESTTLGSRNTVAGYQAGNLNTTGNDIAAFGYFSLQNNTTGVGNSAFGTSALNANTTGTNNTALGFNADVSSGALTNATAIGYNAKVAASNSMVLGGTGANAVKVGIGTTAPAEELEVVGNVRTSSLAGTGTRVVQADANGTLTPLAGGTASQVLLGTGVWGSVPTTNAWALSGNAGTVAGTNFLGTTDAIDFVFKTNNAERARFTSGGFMGIGVSAPAAYLDVYGHNSGTNSLLLRSGNNNNAFNSSQIAFGYSGTNTYMHSIKSRHMSGSDTGNAIDFTVWDFGTDAVGTIGTKKVMTIDGEGNGRVGIGTTTPRAPLEVVGSIMPSSAGGNADIEMNSLTRSTIYPNGANTPADLGLQVRSKGTGVLELNSDNTGNIQMVTGGGNVGIGTNSVTQAKVVINGTQNSFQTYAYLNSAGTVGLTNSTAGYSLYTTGRIAATEFNAFSDARIKDIKGISNSAKDLETLNKIEITDYTFKDSIGKGMGINKKVIAQQVEKVYPQAVATITDVIPDIYTIAKIKDGRVILKNTLQKGDRVKLVFDNRTELVTVLQADEYGFNVAVKDEGKVFVFGREVNDFHTVDYEALSTLNISATQELIKIINQQEAQIRGLKAENTDMNERLTKTEADINQIKSMFNNTISTNSK
nr:tail fiber domain-containing protein [uncultured Flavobacterium sp.]